MATNRDYRVLILTSDPGTVDEVTAIGRDNFEHVTVIFWEMGNFDTKPDVLREMEATDYNLIISYINGIILKRHHLEKAAYGAVNIHPAPPEHPGAFGIWCQPVICREVRTHHGVTVHEMEEIDHGPIYMVERWEVPEEATIQSVVERTFAECLEILRPVAEQLGRSAVGTRCFTPIDERWDASNGPCTVEDVRRWFAALPPDHPAHEERVPFCHPRAIISPPYFDDV